MNLQKQLQTLKDNISVTDWIFLFIGVIFLIGFYVFFKRDVVYITAKFKVTDENALYAKNHPNNEYASAFTVGDAELDTLGRPIAEIKDVEAYKITPEDYVVYLNIKLKAVYDPRRHVYSAQGKNILFGEVFTFSLNKTKFKALVVDFPGFRNKNDEVHTKTVVRAQVRYDNRNFSDVYGIPSFLADAVKAGDTVTDIKGRALAKILDVTIVPAKRVIVNANGQPFVVNDPELKDTYYTIELDTVRLKNQTYMFGFIPVEINMSVPLNFPSVFILPTITEILQ